MLDHKPTKLEALILQIENELESLRIEMNEGCEFLMDNIHLTTSEQRLELIREIDRFLGLQEAN